MLEDARATVRKIVSDIDISIGSVHNILHEVVDRKLSSK